MRYTITILATGLLLASPLRAQPSAAPDVVKVAINGLPSATILSIFKDQEGFLWLGTNSGLCRFDGSNVDIYRNIPGDSLSLPYNGVAAIMEDGAHRLWVGTATGACVLDKRSMRFSRKALVCAEGRLTSYPCRSLMVDRNGDLWACNHDHGLSRYDAASDVFREVPRVRAVSPIKGRATYFMGALQDADGIIWVTHNISIIRYDPATGEARMFVFRPGGHEPPLSTLLMGVQEDASDPNTLWIRSWGAGLVRFDKHAGTFTNTLLTLGGPANVTNIVWSCAQLAPGRLLVGIDHELRPFDTRTGIFGPPVMENGIDPVPFSHPAQVVYDDAEGQRWIGTDRGLFTVPPGTKRFTVWSSPIIPIADDLDGGYWGMSQFTHRRLFHVNASLEVIDSIPLPEADKLLYEGLGLCQLHNGMVWIATPRGLLTYDPRDRSFAWKVMKGLQREGERGPSLGLILERTDGTIWTTALGIGPIIYRPTTDDFLVVKAPPGSPPDRRALCGLLGNLDEHHLWLLFNEGVGVLDTRNYHVAEVMTVNRPGPGAQGFAMVVAHANGELHAVSANNGIYVLKYEEDSLRVLRHYQDVPTRDNYLDAAADTMGCTWIATSSGMVRFDPRNASFQHIGPADGLPIASAFEAFADRQHHVLVKNDRFVRFDPATIVQGIQASAPYIRTVVVNGHPQSIDAAKPQMELHHDQNAITIEYASIALINADQLRYEVRLDGNDADWVDNGRQRTVSYMALAPGVYTFHVRVAGDPDAGAVFGFVIVPAWWQTWWFRIGAALTIALAIFLLSRYILALRYVQRIASLEREHEMTTLRTRIASDIHDDIGSGLTRITMLSREMNNTAEGASDKSRLALHIASASSELIGQLSEIVWTVDPSNDHAERFVAFVRDLVGRQFEELPVRLSTDLSIAEGNEHRTIPPDVKRNVVLILKEALSNALKHAEAKNVSVRMRIDASSLELDVRDDGHGFDASTTNGRGNGLRNLRKRGVSIGGSFELRSDGAGTSIHLRVPLPTPTIMRYT